MKVLSGGEKSRLVLATILSSPGNTLLLDEPTNHLDINSIEMLSKALAAYKGTVIVVSHDDYFVSNLATRIIEMRPGLIRDFPGTLHDYRSYLEDGVWGSGSSDTTQATQKGKPVESDKAQRMRLRDERKKVQRIVEKQEREIATLEETIATKKEILCDPKNAFEHGLLVSTDATITSLEATLETLMNEWSEATARLEEISVDE